MIHAVIQVIFTEWSKEFRGGPGASERNRVPEVEALPLPVENPIASAYLVHTVRHRFGSIPSLGRLPGPALQVHPLDEPYQAGCVQVSFEDGQLRVDYHWTPDAGMPERHTRRGVLRLAEGEWGRVRYNARISAYHTIAGYDYNDWWYEKWVFNIGLFSRLGPRLFLESELVKVHSEMDLLR